MWDTDVFVSRRRNWCGLPDPGMAELLRGVSIRRSEVSADHIIGAFVAPCIHLRCRGMDDIPIRVEGAEQASLVEAHVGLNPLQGILGHEEAGLHCAVVSPKPHGPPRSVIKAVLVRNPQAHGDTLSEVRS